MSQVAPHNSEIVRDRSIGAIAASGLCVLAFVFLFGSLNTLAVILALRLSHDCAATMLRQRRSSSFCYHAFQNDAYDYRTIGLEPTR